MRIPLLGTGGGLVALALLVAAACGGSSGAEIGATSDAAAAETGATGTATTEAGAMDAGVTGDAGVRSGCPASYQAATGSCESTTVTSNDPVCVYPQGTCRCAPAHCGGVVVPIEDDAGSANVWRCSAPRTDGCPEENPNGQACAEAKKSCAYPSGCCTDFATCTGGTWVTRPGACPL